MAQSLAACLGRVDSGFTAKVPKGNLGEKCPRETGTADGALPSTKPCASRFTLEGKERPL